MMKRFGWFSVWLGVLLGLSLPACRTQPRPAAAAPVPEEPSVSPGINANYLESDLDVAAWVQRLERESREIYREREKIMETLAVGPGLSVADIGAGTGLFVPYLSQAVGSTGFVYAVDMVPEFLEWIEKKVRERGLRNVATVLCTERSVALPKSSIDLALLCDVYHHFEYPQSSLASLHRALRPGGDLILIDFKRIPGESSDWVLNHVRGSESLFTGEIEKAGFKRVTDYPILKENYMVRFRKVGP